VEGGRVKRERKVVEFFQPEEAKKDEDQEFKEGRGSKLRDIPNGEPSPHDHRPCAPQTNTLGIEALKYLIIDTPGLALRSALQWPSSSPRSLAAMICWSPSIMCSTAAREW
jgi:hypothetical protein